MEKAGLLILLAENGVNNFLRRKFMAKIDLENGFTSFVEVFAGAQA